MSDIKIIIPTAGRSGAVLTSIKNMILCVPEGEKTEYESHYNCEIIAHPKLKNLAAKRNWILDKFQNKVFMVDDDMKSFERIYVKTDQWISPEKTYDIIQELFYQAHFINAHLFGFSEDPNPNHYNQYKPYMTKGMTGGGAYGLNGDSRLRFCENTTAADSHYITLLNMYYNRYSLIDTRFVCRFSDTFSRSGGQAKKRTLESEKQDTLFLRKMFGEAVGIRGEKTGAKKNHKYQRRIISKW